MTLQSNTRLLVVAEQGIGDTFQFARYGALLKRVLGPESTVCLFCSDALADILRLWPGWDAIYSAADKVLPDFDVQIAMMSIPLALMTGTTEDFITGPVRPTLDPGKWPDVRLRVGMCWRGNPAHPNDRNRSVPEALIWPASQRWCKYAQLWSFQFNTERPLDCLPACMDDWVSTAASLAHMDVVVTVDTAIAHLAGSLGVETWLLLSPMCDWRWGVVGDTSKWYPSMRLFRATKLAQWDDVLDQIEKELQCLQRNTKNSFARQ